MSEIPYSIHNLGFDDLRAIAQSFAESGDHDAAGEIISQIIARWPERHFNRKENPAQNTNTNGGDQDA